MTRSMRSLRIPAGILLGLIGLVGVIGVGLLIPPASLPPFGGRSADPVRQPLPGTLPAPVGRFFRQVYGDEIPIIVSAVISGRGRIRVAGIAFPARFRFIHEAGRGYRHYIEATVFGLPVMKVNEHYLDGEARLEATP